jgi:hypothetical protein
LAEATVGGEAEGTAWMRTLLSLSVKVTAPPLLVRAQPSGTLTVK